MKSHKPKMPAEVLGEDTGVYIEGAGSGVVKVTLARPQGNSEWFLQLVRDDQPDRFVPSKPCSAIPSLVDSAE